MSTYEIFEIDVKNELLKNYPDWAEDINSDALCVCDNGDAYIGSTQFKTNIKLEDYV